MRYFEYFDVNTVFDENLTPEQFSNLSVELVRGNLNTEEAKAANDTINTYVRRLFGLTEEDVRNSQRNMKKINRALKKYTPALFELIEDAVSDSLSLGFRNPFFQNLVEQRNVADGDAIEFLVEDDNQLLAIAKFAGDHHDITLQQLGAYQTFTASPQKYAAAVGTDIRLYVLGKIDFSHLVSKIYESFEKFLMEAVYAELTAISNKMPVESLFTLTTKFDAASKDQIDVLIQDVDALNDNKGVVILGTHVGLKNFEKLDDVDWRSSDAKNERYHTGRLGTYEGTTLIEIPQQKKKNPAGSGYIDAFKNDQIYVFPTSVEKFIKLINWGDPTTYEKSGIGDRIDDTMKFEYVQSFAILSIITQAIGVINVTTN